MRPRNQLYYAKFIIALFVFTITDDCFGQYFLSSANGNSGIVAIYDASSVNYSVTDKRIGFSLSSTNVSPTDLNAQGYPIIPNLTQVVVNAGVTINNNKRDLYTDDKFTPGFDLSADFIHTIESKSKGRYITLFARGKLSSVDTKYAEVDKLDNNKFNINSKTQTLLGLGGGVNFAPGSGEWAIFGLSGLYSHIWNSSIGLEKRFVSVYQSQGTNASGAIVNVAEAGERYIGSLENMRVGQVRFDMTLRLGNFGNNDSNALIGLIGSASHDLRNNKPSSWNVSIGPSIHPPKNIQQVVVATLFEVNDLNNNLGLSPTFKDKFGVRLYVGVPFTLLK